MNKIKIQNAFKSFGESVSRHKPEILVAVGVSGMLTAVVTAVKATPKALMIIEEEKRIRNRELLEEASASGIEDCPRIEKLPKLDVVKLTWKCYVPTAALCITSAACLIGASSTSRKRNAALATAYKITETAFAEYKEKTLETVGEEVEREIRDKVSEKQIENNPSGKNEVIITGKGDTLCYDPLSGRYFSADVNSIEKAVNKLNYTMISDMYISLNDFYDELNLSHTDVGEKLGWNIDDGLIELYFSAQMAENDKPCIVLNYNRAPKYNFSKFV